MHGPAIRKKPHRNRLATASPLEIYEPGFPVPYHHVPCLEVPVHKRIAPIFQKVVPELFEIILQINLIEFQASCLKEAVLEIIEVEHHHPSVELRFGIADAEIQAFGTIELDPGKHLHGMAEKHPFVGTVFTAGPPLGDESVKLFVAKVFLEIPHSVGTDIQHLRDIDPPVAEMAGQ